LKAGKLFLTLCKRFMSEIESDHFLIEIPIDDGLPQQTYGLTFRPGYLVYENSETSLVYNFRESSLTKNDEQQPLSGLSFFMDLFPKIHESLLKQAYTTLRMD